MRFIFQQIKAFNQPAKFSQTAALSEHILFAWPNKFFVLQTLLPKTKSVAAYFRPRRTAFQSEGGHDFKLMADSVSDDRGHRFKVKADSISS